MPVAVPVHEALEVVLVGIFQEAARIPTPLRAETPRTHFRGYLRMTSLEQQPVKSRPFTVPSGAGHSYASQTSSLDDRRRHSREQV
ncbi:hypothetical protein MY3296_005492 [Beauveria thailandica]